VDNFFLHAFSVSKSIGNNIFFITNGQKITDEMIVQIPMKNSVGKSKDCGGGNTWLYIIPLLIPILLIRIPPPLPPPSSV